VIETEHICYNDHMSSLLKNTLLTSVKKLTFNAEDVGWHLIKVSARVKSEKQRGKDKTDDEELMVRIDNKIFPKLGTKQALFNSPASFNGGEQHNTDKTIYFLIQLEEGEHIIMLEPQHGAEVIEVSYEHMHVSDNQIELPLNKQAEDRDRTSWITFVLVDTTLQSCTLEASLFWHWFDGDDIKVAINEKVIKDPTVHTHKDWLFTARPILDILGRTQERTIYADLPKKPLHYIELFADKTPIIIKASFNISDNLASDAIQKYTDTKYGGRNYNQFDQIIQEPVSFWNEFFSKQTYPPTEPLGPNLIKAIVYRESILGYFPNEDIIDVMQVWDAENPAQDTILGKSPANEFVNENQYQHMSYSYPENKVPPQVKTPEESIFWGVRFLYHKAQEFTGAGENGLNSPYGRIWVSWEEAVRRYNANPELKEEYIEEVFSIYRNGIDAKGITLWSSTETE